MNKVIQFKRVNVVDYIIIDGELDEEVDQQVLPDTVRLRLKWQIVIWNRAELLNKLQGKILRKIFVTPSRLFLYVSSGYTLSVRVLTNLGTGLNFLFWWPSD